MALTAKMVTQDALGLPSRGRALLVEKLLASLSGDANPAVERAHLDEVRRRRAVVRSGKAELVDGPAAPTSPGRFAQMTYRFASEALAEFIAAGRYYNQQVPGLGDAFMDEIEAGIVAVLAKPSTWRIVEDDVRRYLVRRFPYGIYYTIEDDRVVIWAVKHLHRDPDYWQSRRR